MIDPELLAILCCPETKVDVNMAEAGLIDIINSKIEEGNFFNRGGDKINKKIDGGLIRADKKYLYPIREDIPIMLIDDAIPVHDLV